MQAKLCTSYRSLTQPSRRCLQAPMASAAHTSKAPGQIGVLFVCLGNICRSPTAEAVFKAAVQRRGLQDVFLIDSCGTGGGNPDWYVQGGWSYHEGDPADERMTAAASKRGVMLTSRSRPLQPVDFEQFDYIIGMEAKNLRAVQVAADYWAGSGMGKDAIPADYKSRCSLMMEYARKHKGHKVVPDPYYSGQDAFNLVLDLLDDACEGLLEHILKEQQLSVIAQQQA